MPSGAGRGAAVQGEDSPRRASAHQDVRRDGGTHRARPRALAVWAAAGVRQVAAAEAAAGRGPDISPVPDPHQLGDQGPNQEGLVPGPGPGSPGPEWSSPNSKQVGGPHPKDPDRRLGPLAKHKQVTFASSDEEALGTSPTAKDVSCKLFICKRGLRFN